MKVSVKVPATIANVGPGFDCLGLAVPLYNTVTIEETVLPGTGVEINVLVNENVTDEFSFSEFLLFAASNLFFSFDVFATSVEAARFLLSESLFFEINLTKKKIVKIIIKITIKIKISFL